MKALRAFMARMLVAAGVASRDELLDIATTTDIEPDLGDAGRP
jgi:hypothetical protein